MFVIENDNKIKMVQGDTGVINLSLENHNLVDGDLVHFALTSKKVVQPMSLRDTPSDILVDKRVTAFEADGSARIVFYPYDTLDLVPGNYLYEIEVRTKAGVVDTVIMATKFTVLEGVIYE